MRLSVNFIYFSKKLSSLPASGGKRPASRWAWEAQRAVSDSPRARAGSCGQ